jgi:hypothetical protein
MNMQNCKIHNLRILELSFGNSGIKNHFNLVLMMRSKVYYKEEGEDLFSSIGHVNILNPKQDRNLKLVS